MSGPAIINSILSANAAVIAVVPAARILSGRMPMNEQIPAIGVRAISSVPEVYVADTPTRLRRERVQIDIKASTYAQQKQIVGLVRAAIGRSRGTVAGYVVDSITPDFEGPDINDDESSIYMQTMDFFVKYVS